MDRLSGKILKGIGGFYYVKTDKGIFECKAKGRFRRDGMTPLVGDDAEVTVLDEAAFLGNLDEILPRRNAFIRPPVANIDILIITISTSQPSPDLFLADKLSVTAQKAGIGCAFCVNKSDLDGTAAREICDIYKKAGFRSICTCTTDGAGIDELKRLIYGRVCAFAGNSGVGKSSILNAVCADAELETGAVSDKIKRGKNTTRHTELLPMPGGGAVLDTPGFSSFEVDEVRAEELAGLFPEIRAAVGGCRFSGCAHIKEPGCSVKAALENGKIPASRYSSYVELYNTLKEIKEWMR